MPRATMTWEEHLNKLVARNIANATHNMTKSREYMCWTHIKSRCYNSDTKQYHNYGGRGITMCDSWKNSFEAFYADMGDMPEKMTIDRIDNNLGYSPDNCRWATRKEQANNRSTNVLYYGKSFEEWGAILGVAKTTLYNRAKRGWSMEKVLSSVIDNRGARHA